MGFLSFLFIVGAVLRFNCVSLYRKERAAINWPTTIASVIELPPQSKIEKVGYRHWVLNRDSDHFLSWTVDGEEYREQIGDKSAVYVSIFKVSREAPDMKDVEIRYDPDDPNDYFDPADEGLWKGFGLGSVVFLMIGASCYLFHQ